MVVGGDGGDGGVVICDGKLIDRRCDYIVVVVVLHVVRDGIWLGWWWGNLFVAALAGTAVQTHIPGTAQQTRVFALIMVACKPRLTIWRTWVFKGFKPLASGSGRDSCTAAATTTTSSSPTTRSPPMTQATKYARKKCHKKISWGQ